MRSSCPRPGPLPFCRVVSIANNTYISESRQPGISTGSDTNIISLCRSSCVYKMGATPLTIYGSSEEQRSMCSVAGIRDPTCVTTLHPTIFGAWDLSGSYLDHWAFVFMSRCSFCMYVWNWSVGVSIACGRTASQCAALLAPSYSDVGVILNNKQKVSWNESLAFLPPRHMRHGCGDVLSGTCVYKMFLCFGKEIDTAGFKSFKQGLESWFSSKSSCALAKDLGLIPSTRITACNHL